MNGMNKWKPREYSFKCLNKLFRFFDLLYLKYSCFKVRIGLTLMVQKSRLFVLRIIFDCLHIMMIFGKDPITKTTFVSSFFLNNFFFFFTLFWQRSWFVNTFLLSCLGVIFLLQQVPQPMIFSYWLMILNLDIFIAVYRILVKLGSN